MDRRNAQAKRALERKRKIRRAKRMRARRIRALVLLLVITTAGYFVYRGVSAKLSSKQTPVDSGTKAVESNNDVKKEEKPVVATKLKAQNEMVKVERPSDVEKPVETVVDPIKGTALDVIEREGITKIYKSYSTQSEVVAELKDGDSLDVIEALPGGWFKVLLPEGKEGYVEAVRIKVDKLPKNNYNKDSAEYTIIVNQGNQNLKLYHNGEEIIKSAVSCGVDSEFTPRGVFVLDKGHSGEWDFANAVNEGYQYFTAFYNHGYLLHSITMTKDKKVIKEEAEKLGTAASHGCIRMPVPVAKYIFENVPTGSILIIE